MRTKSTQSGLTLTEMTVVIATIALLVAIGLPAVRALLNSFESQSGTRSVISAALSSARAIAAKEQRYAGIRFQQDLAGNQFMVFIVHDFDKTGLSPGFRAVEGIKPIKLPESVGVIDLIVRINHNPGAGPAADNSAEGLSVGYLDDLNPANLIDYGYSTLSGQNRYIKNKYLVDTSTFSIVFSPGGKLLVHDVRVRNSDGVYNPDNADPLPRRQSWDDIFNSPSNIIDSKTGMFIQDDYAELGLGAELSRNEFIIYDKIEFDKLGARGRFDYLHSLETIYINPYTGTMILPD